MAAAYSETTQETISAELRATYRLQLSPQFTLDDAAALVDYLSDLGVSHLYSSPFLQAAPGSTHGYDVVNHHQVNAELGGAEARARLSRALFDRGLGLVLDIVPNHMAITGPENPIWWDVLENGQSSPYASYFDVDWDAPEMQRNNAIIVPVLGDQFGRVLEAGEIQVDYHEGEFLIRYYDNTYPVDPRSLGDLLAQASQYVQNDRLSFLAGVYDRLPLSTATDRPSAQRRHRDAVVLGRLLKDLVSAEPEVEAAIRQTVAEVNHQPDLLESFLGEQNFRLAFWRITARELGYRRFFDINNLIGLRIEDEQVFVDTHALILSWLAGEVLSGVRIDHLDGLRNPLNYLQRLSAVQPRAWIVAEKILEPGETLPEDWPLAGTTGYDFMNQVNGLFIDRSAEPALTRFYGQFTGQEQDYHSLVVRAKRKACQELLGSDVNWLTELFIQVTQRHRRYRDFTRNELRTVLQEVAVCLPVYRTYVDADRGEAPERDVRTIDRAVACARENRPEIDPTLFDFFRDLLVLNVKGEVEAELVMRFQQFTGPVMAKGVEDTVFYIYNRLVSLNEVGGDPGKFGYSANEFHSACIAAQEKWPRRMLSTSTHDTKRSEDVRARLDVLSEIPEEWQAAVESWSAANAKYKTGDAPDANDEYLIYQTLVGAWPLSSERLAAYMEKAAREAKRHTSWTAPDPDYEQALQNFISGIAADRKFTTGVEGLVEKVKAPGWINSLSQALIKLTAPGVPDFYQGSELWDYSLVDPDNRRPVDFDLRRRLLAELQAGQDPEQIWERKEEGLPKLWVIYKTLDLRRKCPQAFSPEGAYLPLAVRGEHALGYLRGGEVAVVVPRLPASAGQNWGNTQVKLPDGNWTNELTGERVQGGWLALKDLVSRFPVCLFRLEEG